MPEEEESSSATPQDAHTPSGDWVRLRVAAEAAGVSVDTIRNWFRKGRIGSRMAPGPSGPQWEVKLEEVLDRAGERPLATGGSRVSTLVIPAERLWELYQQAINEAQGARERAARLETEVRMLREELRRERAERDRLVVLPEGQRAAGAGGQRAQSRRL